MGSGRKGVVARGQRDPSAGMADTGSPQLTFERSEEQIGSVRTDPSARILNPKRRLAQAEDESASPSMQSARPPFFPHPDLIPAAVEAGNIGVWSWDIGSNQVACSTNLEEILGLPQGAFAG